jgi:hypothetical protein
MNSELQCISILEEDKNNEVLLTWDYPYMTENLKTLVKQLCPLKNQYYEKIDFFYSKYSNLWIYFTSKNKTEKKDINSFSIVIFSKVKRKN